MKHINFCTLLFALLKCGQTFVSPQKENIEKEVDIIIIGAGASGVATATRLLENNFTNFLVLEGSSRTGGRVNSVPFGGGIIELGGEWVHGKTDNPVFEKASTLGLLYVQESFHNVFDHHYKSDHSKINPDLVTIGVDLIINTFFSPLSNLTVKSYGEEIEQKYWDSVKPLIAAGNITNRDAEEFISWVEKAFNSMDGSPSWNVTARINDYEFVDDVDDFAIVWKGGFSYSTLFDILKRKLPNPANELPLDEKIVHNKNVNLVDWFGEAVIITCEDGSKYKAKKVITTVSLGVLKERADKMFQPSLPPRKLNAIKTLGFGLCNKIYLEFPYHWWPPGGINFVWTAEDKASLSHEKSWVSAIFGFYPTDRLPLNLLCGWICGTEALAMENYSDQEVRELSTWLLKKFVEPNMTVPTPIAFKRSQWGSNPFTLGSWSFSHIDSANVSRKDLEEPVPNSLGKTVLLFAGEASHDTHSSTVHGAVKAGWREADRILEDFSQGNL